jgi:RimJ/RimL family protein N-acetyltransferase
MTAFPTLRTERLLLRALTRDDAAAVQRLVGVREIAAMTLTIPHPYTTSMAEEWIAALPERWERGEAVHWAITRLSDEALIGVIGLEIAAKHERGELGYWVGLPFWGQGYCTEAARAVVDWAFVTLGLARVQAQHVGGNEASGRVMIKLGMLREGVLRQHALKWGQRVDLVCYGLLRAEWEAQRSSDSGISMSASSSCASAT